MREKERERGESVNDEQSKSMSKEADRNIKSNWKKNAISS